MIVLGILVPIIFVGGIIAHFVVDFSEDIEYEV